MINIVTQTYYVFRKFVKKVTRIYHGKQGSFYGDFIEQYEATSAMRPETDDYFRKKKPRLI